MVRQVDGHRYWNYEGALPWDKRCFAFSLRSAATAKREYEAVRGYLVTAVRLPDAEYDGVKTIRHWLNSAPDSKPDRSPFPVWITADEWYWISRALRDWQPEFRKDEKYYEYQVMLRAKNRGLKWQRENWK